MALVVADLLPDRPAGDGAADRRRIPRGVLIGLAAAIKLTPALFVVFLFFLGRRREAFTAIASFAAFTLVGAIFQPHQTVAFWTGLSGGQTRTASPLYTGNQSLLGVFFRIGDSSRTTTLIGLACAGLVALLATVVAAHWWRAGQQVFAVGLVGLATCLASPLSWTHHYVWIVPMGVAVLLPRVALRQAQGTGAGAQGAGRMTQQASPPAEPVEALPRWARYLAGFWFLWVCACLPLAALPYGGGRERHFTFLQSLVADLGPVLGVVLVVGLAWRMVSHLRSRPLEQVVAA